MKVRTFLTVRFQNNPRQLRLSAEHQGKGIISKSVAGLIEMAFTEINMQKVQISAAVNNQPSRKVLFF